MLQSLVQVAMGTEAHLAHSFWQPHRDHWKDQALHLRLDNVQGVKNEQPTTAVMPQYHHTFASLLGPMDAASPQRLRALEAVQKEVWASIKEAYRPEELSVPHQFQILRSNWMPSSQIGLDLHCPETCIRSLGSNVENCKQGGRKTQTRRTIRKWLQSSSFELIRKKKQHIHQDDASLPQKMILL
ncbi:Apoptosis-stimulating of p53 protein 1 [Manis javanica]|nr:Apoptosis-stimulating of p53 protein 1 [Manis javanica]